MAVTGLAEVLQQLAEHETLLWSLAGCSVLIFLGSLLALPVVIARLPSDYFMASRRRRRIVVTNPVGHAFIVVGKNILGAVLVFSGFLILVLLDRGLLTLALGIMILIFRGNS